MARIQKYFWLCNLYKHKFYDSIIKKVIFLRLGFNEKIQHLRLAALGLDWDQGLVWWGNRASFVTFDIQLRISIVQAFLAARKKKQKQLSVCQSEIMITAFCGRLEGLPNVLKTITAMCVPIVFTTISMFQSWRF